MIDDDAVEWRQRAACLNTIDVNLFHPTRMSGGRAPNYTQTVRDACDSCPVRQPCLDDALHGETRLGYPVMGYRGGHTPEQRIAILRQRGARGAGQAASIARRSNERRRLLKAARSYGVPAAQLAAAYGMSTRAVVRATATR